MIVIQSVTSLEGVTPRVIAVCPRLPPGHSFHGQPAKWPCCLTISAGRNEKRPLTHRRWSFAVRHRLRLNLLASPCGPLMVELFTVRRYRHLHIRVATVSQRTFHG